MRAERTELGHVEEWLRSLALARPEVELRISHNGRAGRVRGVGGKRGPEGARLRPRNGEERASYNFV